jgi:hypothetical protein
MSVMVVSIALGQVSAIAKRALQTAIQTQKAFPSSCLLDRGS